MKKKVLIGLLVLACALCASTMVTGFAASAATVLDEADACFVEYLSAEMNDKVIYERKALYDMDLNQNGWQYDFSVNDKSGYALMTQIVVNDGLVYEVEELCFDKTSPFDAGTGLPIYITHKTYIDYSENYFYDLATNELITEETMSDYSETGFGYKGSSAYYNKIQTINYSSKATTQEYSIQYDLPTYKGPIGGSNCANIAGSIAIGYYDRFSTNLIPAFQTYRTIGSLFQYKAAGAEITGVQNNLYQSMSTDVGQPGTTYTGFQNGMGSYASGKGYTYSTSNIFSLGSFDFQKYKTAVQSGKPVTFFLNNYALVSGISSNGSTDTVSNVCFDVAHVIMACGYRVDTYYNSSGGVIDTRTYLKVSSGLPTAASDICYLNINSLTTINHAGAITMQ